MKKLFSTLGMMALVSLCLFSSCKDEDYPATETQSNATANTAQVNAAATAAANNAVAEALAAATAAAKATDPSATVAQTGANEVTTTYSDNTTEVTTTTTSYTYEVNGVSYDSMEAAMAALSKLPAGTTATVVATLHQTTTTQKYDANGNKTGTPKVEEKTASKESEVKIPELGEQPETSAVEVPTSVTDTTKTKSVDVTVTTTEKGQHSGGGIK